MYVCCMHVSKYIYHTSSECHVAQMVKALSKAKENNDEESVRLLGQIMSREEEERVGTE